MSDTTTAEAPAAATSNTGITLAKFYKDVETFGKLYGQGQNSRPAMAISAVRASTKLADVGPDKAEEIFERFQKAAAAAKGIEYKTEGSIKQQVSKFKQFLVAAAKPGLDFEEVLTRGIDVIREFSNREDNPMTGSAYDNLVLIAREQIKSCAENNNAVGLTTEQIKGFLAKQKAEKSELEKLAQLIKSVRKSHDWAPKASLPGIEDAVRSLEEAYINAGGAAADIAPKPTKEDVKAAVAQLMTQQMAARLIRA